MNIKKILSVALALLMIFSLVGCKSNKRQIVEVTLSTEDAEAILAAAGITLPAAETMSASGSTVKWFSWWDSFHNYDEDEIVNTGFFTFKEKYGCEVEWIECEWGARFDDLANLILAGTAPDFYPGEANTFPEYSLKGVFQSVDDYIDYNDPLWSGTKEYADKYFSLGGKHYLIVTDLSFGNVVAYNRRVMEEWGFEDPAELYYNDEWTWDKFYDMCVEFSDPDEDRYALDGFWYSAALMRSCGQSLVSYNTETQIFETNIDDPAIERAADLLYNISKNQCIFPRWNNNWALRNEIEGGGMKEGLCLFYIGGSWMFTGTVESISDVWGDVSEGELMFCPLPRDPNGDGTYYTESTPTGYCLVSGASNPEGVALLAACDRFKVLDPTVISIDRRQLEEIYLWTDEMLEMYDTCVDIANSGSVIVVYDAGYGSKLDNVVNTLEGNGANQEASTWAQLKEKYTEQLVYYVDALNADIDKYING